MDRWLASLVVASILAGVSSLTAQAPAEQPSPNVLQIYREVVKPGKTSAHEKVEVGWPRAYAKAKWPTNYLAIVSVTGPSEAWFITGYESFAALQQEQTNSEQATALKAETDQLSAQDGEFLSDFRSMIAVYRDDMSYGARSNLALMRYFTITRYLVRPGHAAEFVEARKIVKAAHEKANVPERLSVWQVVSGAPAGTYLTIAARKSLGELDDNPKLHGSAYQAALGGEAGEKKLAELNAASVINSEQNHFAFSPKMSYPPKEWIDADPTFWAPKPKGTSSAASGAKPVAKP